MKKNINLIEIANPIIGEKTVTLKDWNRGWDTEKDDYKKLLKWLKEANRLRKRVE